MDGIKEGNAISRAAAAVRNVIFRSETDAHVESLEPEMNAPMRNTADVPRDFRQDYRYTVTVTKTVTTWDDVLAIGLGLKRGEQQIVNLANTDPAFRERAINWLSGANFMAEGTWEEVGQHVYTIVPTNAYVEVAPSTPQSVAIHN